MVKDRKGGMRRAGKGKIGKYGIQLGECIGAVTEKGKEVKTRLKMHEGSKWNFLMIRIFYKGCLVRVSFGMQNYLSYKITEL